MVTVHLLCIYVTLCGCTCMYVDDKVTFVVHWELSLSTAAGSFLQASFVVMIKVAVCKPLIEHDLLYFS